MRNSIQWLAGSEKDPGFGLYKTNTAGLRVLTTGELFKDQFTNTCTDNTNDHF